MKKFLICFSIVILLFSACYKAEAASFEQELLMQINSFRAENRLTPLVKDANLRSLAYDFSYKMKVLQVFSHEIITQKEWAQMAKENNVSWHCFEFLVYAPTEIPDPRKSFLCLEASPAHREGLLRKDTIVYGAAYVEGNGCSYVTVYIGEIDKKGDTYEPNKGN